MYFNRTCNSSRLPIVWFKWMQLVSALLGIAKAQGTEAKKTALDQVCERLVQLEKALGKCSKCKDFFNRDEIEYVDIALESLLGLVNVAEKMNDVKLLDENKMSGLEAWAKKFCEKDAAKDEKSDNDKLLEYATKVFLSARANPMPLITIN